MAKFDLKAGGMFLYSQTPPGAPQALWGKFVYDEYRGNVNQGFKGTFDQLEAYLAQTRSPKGS